MTVARSHHQSASRLRFYSVVTLPAAALMALEIVSSRLLAPHFGNSVYVWGSIIGVFLAMMSAGYWIGGRLADRRPDLKTLAEVLLASSTCQAVVLVAGRRLVAFLGDLTGGEPAGVLLATLVLFGPATLFLAMVSPFAVKIATADLKSLGGTTGHLFALSTAGSLVGTLGSTFLLIPHLALEPILATILAVTVTSSLLAVGLNWKSQKLQTLLASALLILVLLPSDLFQSKDNRVLAERLSPFQTLVVTQVRNIRSLYSDGTLHASIDMETGRTALVYAAITPAGLLMQPKMRTMAVIGMGGGAVGLYLQELRPSLVVDHVDVDQAVVELARDYLGFQPNDHHRLHVVDGRRFLSSRPEARWDYIYIDAYIGQAIPFHLTTKEFFQEVRRHLTDGGVLGMNLLTGMESPLGLSLAKSVSTSFPQIYVFNVPGGNTLLMASTSRDRLDLGELQDAARQLDLEVGGVHPEPSMLEIADLFRPVEMDLDDVEVLTDSFAPVNELLRKSLDSSSFGAQGRSQDQAEDQAEDRPY